MIQCTLTESTTFQSLCTGQPVCEWLGAHYSPFQETERHYVLSCKPEAIYKKTKSPGPLVHIKQRKSNARLVAVSKLQIAQTGRCCRIRQNIGSVAACVLCAKCTMLCVCSWSCVLGRMQARVRLGATIPMLGVASHAARTCSNLLQKEAHVCLVRPTQNVQMGGV